MTRTVSNMLITGRPGVGKTTLIRRVLDALGVDAGGFTTEEIRENGRRVGFSINDMRGASAVMAHVSAPGPFRVAKYGVSKRSLEEVGVPAITAALDAGRLVVMDEIGRMELCSSAFQEAVLRALDSHVPVLGTLQDTSNAFLDAIRAREDVEVLTVTEGNRESAVDLVAGRVRRLLESSDGGKAQSG